jgi:hypothetical protein
MADTIMETDTRTVAEWGLDESQLIAFRYVMNLFESLPYDTAVKQIKSEITKLENKNKGINNDKSTK